MRKTAHAWIIYAEKKKKQKQLWIDTIFLPHLLWTNLFSLCSEFYFVLDS